MYIRKGGNSVQYRIADFTVRMDASGRTRQQAQPYLTEQNAQPDILLDYDLDKIAADNPHMQNRDELEYIVSGFLFFRKILCFDAMYVHASCVICDGKAYLFSASSGTGKSTHTKKWCRLFGARYLNDDKPILRCIDGKWFVYGSPWSGKEDLSSNEGVPLGGIAFLQRGTEDSCVPIAPREALPLLMRQTSVRITREEMEKKLQISDLLLRTAPIWLLTCTDSDAAAYVSHSAMTGFFRG